MGNENTSGIAHAPGMETNQDESAMPPTVRFNIGDNNTWFISEN